MTFTPEETEALESLEKVFGAREITLTHISQHYDYHEWARNAMESAATYYAYAKLKDSTDWEEINRLKREEQQRRLAARSEEVRLGIMTGIISGLLPPISKAMPEGARTMFDIDEDEISLMVLFEGESLLTIQYSKGSLDLSITVDGEHFLEDAEHVNGNQSPRDQFKGIEAVHTYLDSLELDT